MEKAFYGISPDIQLTIWNAALYDATARRFSVWTRVTNPNTNILLFSKFAAMMVAEVIEVIVNELLMRKGMTQEQLATASGIPVTTLGDICLQKTRLDKCEADIVHKLAHALDVPSERLIEDALRTRQREESYEYGLPGYLQHDLDAYKEGLAQGSSLLDCLWGELYGSINMAEISDGVISPAHADYLRRKFLWGETQE